MHNKPKCNLDVCICLARVDDPYCSDYCRQASAQGAERSFCQCEHSVCSKPEERDRMPDVAGLPTSMSFAPGRVTIEYSDRPDLRTQLALLLNRLGEEIDATPRFPPERARAHKAAASESA